MPLGSGMSGSCSKWQVTLTMHFHHVHHMLERTSRPSLQMSLNWPNLEANQQCTLAHYSRKHDLTCGQKIKTILMFLQETHHI